MDGMVFEIGRQTLVVLFSHTLGCWECGVRLGSIPSVACGCGSDRRRPAALVARVLEAWVGVESGSTLNLRSYVVSGCGEFNAIRGRVWPNSTVAARTTSAFWKMGW